MLTVKQVEEKFQEIRQTIKALPDSLHKESYIHFLERKREEYHKEYLKALEREVNDERNIV